MQVVNRLQNVLASLYTYAQATLVTIDGLKLAWPEVPFNSKGLTSWLRMDVLGDSTVESYRVMNSSGHPGRRVRLIIQIACFYRCRSAGAPSNLWGLYQLRDKVMARFPKGMEIDIKDYQSGSPGAAIDVAQVMDAYGTNPTLSMAQSADLSMYAVTVTIEYDEPHGGA
jgi:hypothetical protein